jgi:hypothetical protein
MNGTEMEVESFFGDYREVDGYVMAHSIAQKMGAMGDNTVLFEEVVLNPEVPADQFAMPKVDKSETAPAIPEKPQVILKRVDDEKP